MHTTTPTRTYAFAAVCAIFAVSLLYQIVKGWDTLDFLLRGLFSTAVSFMTWRSGILVSRGATGAGATRRLALQALCWVAVAAALFAGFALAG